MDGCRASRTHSNPDALGPVTDPAIQWKADERASLGAVDDSTVYLIDYDRVVARSAADGSQRWSIRRQALHGEGARYGAALALAEEFLLVPWGNHETSQLMGLDPKMGEERWNVELDIRTDEMGITSVGAPSAPLVTSNGGMVTNNRGDVYSVSPNGLFGASQQWRYVPDAYRPGRFSALAAKDDLVIRVQPIQSYYNQSRERHLYVTALGATSGDLRWRYGTPGQLLSLAIAHDRVYLHVMIASSYTKEAFNSSSETTGIPVEPRTSLIAITTTALSSSVFSGIPSERLDFDEELFANPRIPVYAENSVAIGRDAVYVVVGRNVIAYAPTLQEELWQTQLSVSTESDRPSRVAIVSGKGTIYVRWGTELFAVDSESGGLQWQLRLDAKDASGPLMLAGETLYSRTSDSDRVVAVAPRQ